MFIGASGNESTTSALRLAASIQRASVGALPLARWAIQPRLHRLALIECARLAALSAPGSVCHQTGSLDPDAERKFAAKTNGGWAEFTRNFELDAPGRLFAVDL